MNDNDFMRIANVEAQKALERGDYPAGCVIVKNGEIISRTSNRVLTRNDPAAHSEILAISDACKKIGLGGVDGCMVYSNIEPCLMCAQAMKYAGIRKVVYGTEHKEYGGKKTFSILKKNGIAKEIEVVSGIQKAKASKLLAKFLKIHPNFLKQK